MRKENTGTVLIRFLLCFLMLFIMTLILVWGVVHLPHAVGSMAIALMLISRFMLLGIDKILSIMDKKV